jgi:hypothetical protein
VEHKFSNRKLVYSRVHPPFSPTLVVSQAFELDLGTAYETGHPEVTLFVMMIVMVVVLLYVVHTSNSYSTLCKVHHVIWCPLI